MKTLSAFLLISCLVTGCRKSSNQTSYIKAIVVQTSDISCNLPVLDFSEDSIKIRNLTGRGDLMFAVLQLTANLNIQNKKLDVLVTTLQPHEDFPCNTLGINYPHLKIVAARDR